MGKSRQDTETKADRKFDKKLQFYAKVRDTVASLNAQKSIAKASLNAQKSITKKNKLRRRQKKLKAYDLSTLTESLPELKAPKQPTPAAELKLNCKSRHKLLLKETKQLNAVLNHPAFQSDPLEAIHQHLLSTQPVEDQKPKKKFKKVKGKKSNKLSTESQSMDF